MPAFGAGTFGLYARFLSWLKWVLVGRWKPQEIEIWSLAYLRFWLVKTLVVTNPLVLFVGSPLYMLYLGRWELRSGRALCLHLAGPVTTDMLTIGERAVIGKDTVLRGYQAAGVIQTGSCHSARTS